MAKRTVSPFQAAYEQSEQLLHLMRHSQVALRIRNVALHVQVDSLERIAKVGAYAPAPKAPRPTRVPDQHEVEQIEKMARAKAYAAANPHLSSVAVGSV